jgi:hypothetical protein
MSIPHVALVSLTRKVKPAELAQTSAALQKQVLRDLGPLWGLTAAVDAFPDLKSVPLGHWPIVIAENIKAPGLAGFHSDKHHQPYSLVQYDPSWQLTCSHELCEMLVDPYGNRLAHAGSPDPRQGKVSFLVEVCDPCEDAAYAYSINGILVSDFYTPQYFDPQPVSTVRYSYTGAITKPLEVLRNGYLSWLDPVSKRWFQKNCFHGEPKIGPVKGMKTNGQSLRSQMDRIMKNPNGPQTFAAADQKHRGIQAKTFKAGVARAAEWKTEIARHLKGARTHVLLFLIGCTMALAGKGQVTMTFDAGVARNNLLTNIQNRSWEGYKPGNGLFVSTAAQFWLGKYLFVQSGFSWAQKSYSLEQKDTSLTVLNQHTRNDYLQGELGLGGAYFLKIIDKPRRYSEGLQFTGWAGVYEGYWVDGHINGAFSNLINTAEPSPQAYSYSEAYTFDGRRDNRWEFGWQAGLRIYWKDTRDRTAPYLSASIYQSLTDQQKNYMLQQIPRYNQTWALALGIITQIGKR